MPLPRPGPLADWDREIATAPTKVDAFARFLPVMFYRFSATAEYQFRFSYVSPYSSALTGFAPAEILADPLLFVGRFHPDDVPGLRAHLKTAAHEKADWLHELRYLHRAGHYIWVRSHDWRTYGAGGSIEGIGYWVDISANKAAEAAAWANEERFRDLIENSPQGILIRRGYDLLFVNQAHAHLFGYETPEDLRALASLEQLVHAEDRERLFAYHAAREREEPAPESYEFRGLRKDGGTIWVSNTVRRIVWEGQNATQVISTDITGRVRAEERLRASEERYRDLIENSRLGFMVQRDLQFLYANRAYAQIYGYESPQEVIAIGFTEQFVHPEDRERLLGYRTQRAAGLSAPESYEFRGIRKDGSTIWLTNTVRPVEWEGLPASQTVTVNITERKLAEQALRASEERYRDLIENSPQGIVIHGDLRVKFVNSTFLRLLGYESLDEVLARGSVMAFIHPEDRERLLAYQTARTSGQPAPTQYEVRAVRKDGGTVWMSAVIRRIEWEGFPATQAVCTDVTESKRAEQAVRESEQRYRYLVENSLQGICVFRDGVVLFANDAAARIWGFERPEQMIGWRMRERLNHAYLPAINARSEGPIGKKFPLIQYEGLRMDGKPIWLESSAISIPWEGQTAKLSTQIDITERKRAEQDLLASQRRLLDLFESSPLAILVHREFRPLFVNQACTELYGYTSREEMLGQPSILPSFAAGDEDRSRARNSPVLGGQSKSARQERVLIRADGGQIWVDCLINRIEWEGQPSLVVSYVDITERKRAEGEVAKTQQRLASIVAGSIQGILVHRDFKPLFANEAFVRLHGYSSAAELLEDHDALDDAAPEDRERIREFYWKRMRGEDAPARYEFHARRRDGALLWMENLVSVIDWEGAPAALVAQVDITERKRAEEALAVTKERFQKILEGSIQGIVVHRDFQILFANTAYAKMYGYDSAEDAIRHKNLLDNVAPEDRERVRGYYRARMSGGEAPSRYESLSQKRDGSLFWLENLVTVIEWDGAPAVLVTEVDISERKLAEQALRVSEQRYRDLVEGSIQGICVSQNGRYVFANKAEAEIFGFVSPQEMMGLPSDSLYSAESNALRFARREQMANGIIVGPAEFEAVRQDGRKIWLETRTRMIDWEGSPGLLAVHVDITERRLAEQALIENRAYLTSVLDNAADGIITIDRHGTVEYFNLQAERIFGYSRDEVIGRNVAMLVPEPHREKHQAYLERYLETGQSQIIGIGRDTTGSRKDGTAFALSIDVSEVRTGNRIAFAAIVKDISEQKRQEQELLAMAQGKSAMLSNLSHELRSPLTSILGFAQLMEVETNLTEGQRKDVKTIEEAALHLLDLMNDVLDIQKMEAGFRKLNREEFDLVHTLESLASMFRPRCEAKRVALALRIAPETPRYVNGDPRKLRQVLINLLGNAAKFVESGEIALVVRPAPEGLWFSVKDTGPGIPPGDLNHLMKPFRQASGSTEGAGLGLSISKGLVEIMGGRLEAVSEVGVGSEFSFVLPLARSDEPVQLLGDTRDAGVAAPRVLVVDDDALTREWLVRLLSREGFRVEQAGNGKQALRRFVDFAPQIAIMDLRMPVMDGLEAAARMRAMRGGAALTIVALSGDEAGRAEAAAAPDGRFDRVLAKPIETGNLLAVLREYLPKDPRRLN